MNSTDFGHDLATVQRLQRKHEGLERDLAAIGEKMKDLREESFKLMMTHPDQKINIYEHQHHIDNLWNELTKNKKADARKAKLHDSYELQSFLSGFRSALKMIFFYVIDSCIDIVLSIIYQL